MCGILCFADVLSCAFHSTFGGLAIAKNDLHAGSSLGSSSSIVIAIDNKRDFAVICDRGCAVRQQPYRMLLSASNPIELLREKGENTHLLESVHSANQDNETP